MSNSLYLAFHRPAWSLGIAWIIFACALGYGGAANKILALPIFEILSRLSYGMYLIHYSIIQLRYLAMRSPILFDITDQVITISFKYSSILTFQFAAFAVLGFLNHLRLLRCYIFPIIRIAHNSTREVHISKR